MNVLLRLLKVMGIAVLFILNENTELLQKKFSVPINLSSGIIGFCLFFLLAELTRDILTYLYKRRKKLSFKINDNVIVGLNNMYYLIVAGGALYFFLHLLKLKPSQFFTGLSLISAALAVIMKDYFSNIFSGMILAFSDKLKIGDYVQLGTITGEIIDFSLTMVTIRNDDDELVYVPASHIYTHPLINYSTLEYDTVTVPFELSNKMKLTFHELDTNIKDAMEPYRSFLVDEIDLGTLMVSSTNQESTSFKYRYTLSSKNILMNRKIKSDLLKAVYEHTKINTVS